MSDDATLDAFGDRAAESNDDGERTDPAPVTSSWRADAACSACGESAARRWTADGERVCADCVPWTTTGSEACDQ
ncbi:DUF7573 domain-containing protein [Halobacterium litoreum]|uniref:DUF7573 domain-containing protein n=1 Tax=Halobacterium litoreum TaxID=2039234 RepID=A0ABD5NFT0_9EURY|nr:hypothetical protein [Halobacterium litoreum]UHH13063.1 hypothetical protein LT972_12980 [Halobacterium litoreum]